MQSKKRWTIARYPCIEPFFSVKRQLLKGNTTLKLLPRICSLIKEIIRRFTLCVLGVNKMRQKVKVHKFFIFIDQKTTYLWFLWFRSVSSTNVQLKNIQESSIITHQKYQNPKNKSKKKNSTSKRLLIFIRQTYTDKGKI